MNEKLLKGGSYKHPWEVRLHQVLTPLENAQILLVNYFAKQEAMKTGKRTPVIEWMIVNTSQWGLRISESVELLCGQIHLNPQVSNETQDTQKDQYLTPAMRDLLEKLIQEDKRELARAIDEYLNKLAIGQEEKLTSYIDLRTTKYGKPRDVHIGPVFSGYIQEYLDWKRESGEPVSDDAPFFYCPWSKRRKYTPQGLRKAYKRAIKKAGIHKQGGPHIGRHTYGSIMGPKDIKKVQKELGHANISTTNIYVHLLDPKNKEFVTTYEKLMYAVLEIVGE